MVLQVKNLFAEFCVERRDKGGLEPSQADNSLEVPLFRQPNCYISQDPCSGGGNFKIRIELLFLE